MLKITSDKLPIVQQMEAALTLAQEYVDRHTGDVMFMLKAFCEEKGVPEGVPAVQTHDELMLTVEYRYEWWEVTINDSRR